MKIKIIKTLKESKQNYQYARKALRGFKEDPYVALDQIASDVAQGRLKDLDAREGMDGTEYFAEFDSDKTAKIVKDFLDRFKQLSYGFDLGTVMQNGPKLSIIPLPPSLDLF